MKTAWELTRFLFLISLDKFLGLFERNRIVPDGEDDYAARRSLMWENDP